MLAFRVSAGVITYQMPNVLITSKTMPAYRVPSSREESAPIVVDRGRAVARQFGDKEICGSTILWKIEQLTPGQGLCLSHALLMDLTTISGLLTLRSPHIREQR